MNIHIAMLGRVTEPIKTASNRFGRIDKLILIVGKEFEQNAEDLKTEFEKIWGIDVTYYTIDPFNKNGVMEIIEIMKKIKNDYPKDNMYINKEFLTFQIWKKGIPCYIYIFYSATENGIGSDSNIVS